MGGKKRKHQQHVSIKPSEKGKWPKINWEETEINWDETETIVDDSGMDISTKVAAAIALPGVVRVHSRKLPGEMAEFSTGFHHPYMKKPGKVVNRHCGTIIECEEDIVTHTYFTTIITSASLFVRTNGVQLQPHQTKVDVYLSQDNKLCHGKVLACDFHYNLAAIQIQTDSPLQTATLRALDDVLPIHPTQRHPHLQQPPERSFQLLPHSHLFQIFPGTKIISLCRFSKPSNLHVVSSAVFGTASLNDKLDCNELYWLEDHEHQGLEICGGPVINCSGEVIGLTFHDFAFLPTNIISRWWKHFKSCGQYRRPWLGIKVSNLHSSHLDFLGDLMRKFPNINTGVVVTKAAEDSPAYCSGIRPKDVIVECNGKSVGSKLQLFDIVWDKVGESVEVTVLRTSRDGEKFKLCLTVGETTPDNFYKWPRRPSLMVPLIGRE